MMSLMIGAFPFVSDCSFVYTSIRWIPIIKAPGKHNDHWTVYSPIPCLYSVRTYLTSVYTSMHFYTDCFHFKALSNNSTKTCIINELVKESSLNTAVSIVAIFELQILFGVHESTRINWLAQCDLHITVAGILVQQHSVKVGLHLAYSSLLRYCMFIVSESLLS